MTTVEGILVKTSEMIGATSEFSAVKTLNDFEIIINKLQKTFSKSKVKEVLTTFCLNYNISDVNSFYIKSFFYFYI